jgi:hypothetical protein
MNQSRIAQPNPIINQFINRDNMQMIWDVLRETDIYESLSNEKRGEFQQSVIANMNKFYNKEKNSPNKYQTQDLITMNKSFIESMISELSLSSDDDLPPLKLKPPTNYNDNANAMSKPLMVTAKDIQAERQTQFESRLNKQREDFDSVINVKKPPLPEFADKLDEPPISEMESLIAKTIAQRNFEMDQIQKSFSITAGSSASANSSFLEAKDTSLKTEKQRDYEQTLKYIKIEKEELGQNYVEPSVIDLSKRSENSANRNENLNKKLIINEQDNETYYYNDFKKQNNSNINYTSVGTMDNIFSKLKQKPLPPEVSESFETKVLTALEALNKRMDELSKKVDAFTSSTI